MNRTTERQIDRQQQQADKQTELSVEGQTAAPIVVSVTIGAAVCHSVSRNGAVTVCYSSVKQCVRVHIKYVTCDI